MLYNFSEGFFQGRPTDGNHRVDDAVTDQDHRVTPQTDLNLVPALLVSDGLEKREASPRWIFRAVKCIEK